MAEFEDCWKDDDKGGQSRGCVVMQMTIFDHHFVTITRIILVTLHPFLLYSHHVQIFQMRDSCIKIVSFFCFQVGYQFYFCAFLVFKDLKLSSPSPKSSPPRPKTNPKPVQNQNPSPIGTGVTPTTPNF